MTTNSLEPVADTQVRDSLIVDPGNLFEQMEDWRQKGYHVLTPATRIQRFAPNWGASVSMVLLNSTVDYENGRGTDTYFDPGNMKKPGALDTHERGISRIGLDRIARCAGISWDPNFSVRVDTRLIMHLWEFRAVGVGMDFDGMPFTIQGTREVDLRDESAQIGGWSPQLWREECEAAKAERRSPKPINGWSDRRVLASRSHGLQLAETKAKDRAIRSLGLSHIYTVAQLKSPFIVIKACYLPDMQDADIRAMVAEQALKGTRALFAPQVSRSTIHAIDVTPQQGMRELPPALAPDTTRHDLTPAQERQAEPVARPASLAGGVKLVKLEPVGERQAPSVDAHPLPQPGPSEAGWRRNVELRDIKELKTGSGPRGEWALVKLTLGLAESDAQSFTTLNTTVVAGARELQSRGGRADVLVEKDDKSGYLNITDILPVGALPTLPGMLDTERPPASESTPLAAKDMRW